MTSEENASVDGSARRRNSTSSSIRRACERLKARDAKRQIRRPLRVFHDRVGDGVCFAGVEALSDSSLVARASLVAKVKAGFLTFRVRTRKEHEPIVIELVVRDGDQRFVPAAVVPAQHAFGCARGAETYRGCSRGPRSP